MSDQLCAQCHEKRGIQKGRKICYHCRLLNQLVNAGTVREPDYPDVTVAKYKAPMEEVKDGYGYLGAITETNDGKMIQCHICGYYFGRLGNHISTHGLTARDYKIKFGLRIKDGLLSIAARKQSQDTYNANGRLALDRLRKLQAGNARRREEDNWHTGGGIDGRPTRDTPQYRNEQGTCKAQTLAKIKRLAKMQEGPVTWRDFAREYGETSTITHWFGSWSKALEAANLETYDARRKRQKAEMTAGLLARMEAFYKKHGRTPLSSDFNADNDLPSYQEASRRYGTLNNARIAAGIPQLICVAPGRWVEQL